MFERIYYTQNSYYCVLATSYFGTMANKAIKFSDIIKSYEDQNTSGEFYVWIEKLELVAQLQGITDLPKFVPLFLSGPAFAVYQQLGDTTKGDYDMLKAELSTAFSSDPFTSYDELKSRVLLENESVDVYLADIRRLVALMGHGHHGEPLIRCAFVSGLPSDVAMQLKSAVNADRLQLPELVGKARAMLASRGGNSTFACAGVKSNTKSIRCFVCSGNGHVARECPNKRKERFVSGRPSRDRRCYICDSPDHLANKCQNRSGNGAGGVSASDTRPALQN